MSASASASGSASGSGSGSAANASHEHDAVRRRSVAGEIETLLHDPRVLWPDTLSLATDGYLYFTANQIERGAGFHDGHDLRQKPYVLFRVKVDGTRIHQ